MGRGRGPRHATAAGRSARCGVTARRRRPAGWPLQARGKSDVDVLRDLPEDKSIAAGVIDVRNLEVEQPEQVAERIRRVIDVVPAERVTLTTDCGMKQLPRRPASAKLASLVEGARIVRSELQGT